MGSKKIYPRLFVSTLSRSRSFRMSLGLAVVVCLVSATINAADVSELADDGSPNPAVETINQAGIALYQSLRAVGSPADNLIISPVSIVTAVSLLGSGAGGDTAGEFARALRGDAAAAAYHANFGRLLASFAPPVDESDLDSGLLEYWPEFTIASRLWVSDRIEILKGFLQMSREHYRADVTAFDETAPDATAAAINTWVSEVTAGKIGGVIDAETIAGSSVLLLNAVSLKASWAVPFLPERTTAAAFHIAPQEQVNVQMMKRKDRLRYAKIIEPGPAVEILELPCTGPFRMLILLPQGESALAAVESRLSSDVWRTWLEKLFKREVTVWMPRFRVATGSSDLIPALHALGLRSIVDKGQADFSRISSQPVAPTTIRHSAMIVVDENGIEAAAVTDSGMRQISAIDAPPVEFRVDRPFVFVIDDAVSGTILFLGRLVRP